MIENIRDVFWGILFIIVKVAKLRTLEFFHGIKDYSASSYVFVDTSLFPNKLDGFLRSRALPNVSL